MCKLDGHSQWSLTSMQAVAFCVLVPGLAEPSDNIGRRARYSTALPYTLPFRQPSKAQRCSVQSDWCMQAARSLAAAHLQPSDHHPPGNGSPAYTPHLCICSYSSASLRAITHRQGQWGPPIALAQMLPAPLQLSLCNSAHTAQGLCCWG